MGLTRHQLRAGRLLAGLSQADLAGLADEPVALIRNIESGAIRELQERTQDRLRAALSAVGVEFGARGWLRHRDDRLDDCEPPAGSDALRLAINDLESQDWRAGRMLARVLRVCSESETAAYSLIFDALRTGLYVLICRDMSDGLLVEATVEASCGLPDWPDTLLVRITTTGGMHTMRALHILGDDLLHGLDYRPIGPIPQRPPALGWKSITDPEQAIADYLGDANDSGDSDGGGDGPKS